MVTVACAPCCRPACLHGEKGMCGVRSQQISAYIALLVQLIQYFLYSLSDTSCTAPANTGCTAHTLPPVQLVQYFLYSLYNSSCTGMCRMLLQQLMMMCLLYSLLVAPYPVKRAKSLRGILLYSMLSKYLQLAVMH